MKHGYRRKVKQGKWDVSLFLEKVLKMRKGTKIISKFGLLFLVSAHIVFLLTSSSFAAEKVPTKIIVRVVSKDSKVIGSGVGGAFVRIKNLETGEILAQGKQGGGTGDTERIMIRPRRRGETIYGTSGAASFRAEIPLDRPTQVEIYTEAPLAYPHAIQKGLKTVTLIPGKHILGEGVIIELDGLIVNILNPSPKEVLKKGEEVTIKAEVRML
jgi:hypothetical protein